MNSRPTCVKLYWLPSQDHVGTGSSFEWYAPRLQLLTPLRWHRLASCSLVLHMAMCTWKFASMATCKHLCVPDVSAVRCSCKLWLVGSAVVWEMIMDEAYFRAQLQLARDRAAQRRGDPPPARIPIMPNSVGAAGQARVRRHTRASNYSICATYDPQAL